ncbi:MAG: glycoside hydrolase family 3 protein [Erysipelotrichaceae bacterium]|nr:glycoside hydrolase family 3 protein [Erysipelotrichaceae bacterium]
MVDLKAKPFYLNDEQEKWVYDTLNSMTLEEKCGQTLLIVGFGKSDEELLDLYKKVHYGGIMHRPGPAKEIKERNDLMQKEVKVPLLVAANMEFGGQGVAVDGTFFSNQIGIAATGDPHEAYNLGDICGAEARAVGVTYAFAPVVDIDMNWRNPITNTRVYGSDPNMVKECGLEYLRGIRQHNVAVSIKHFPGDGVDERDQHILPSVNSLSCEDWDKTYGMIYQALIDEGARTVMAGHIMQPAYTRHFSPGIKDEDIMPATLSKELITDLLRGKLGFNGVVCTDAANMVGMCCMMEREKLVPHCIQIGCDIFLFGRNVEEDHEYLVEGVKNGLLTEERLDEAVTRILALKASLNLNGTEKFTDENYMDVISCEDHLHRADVVADKAITLVKDTQQLLPVTPEKYPKILLSMIEDDGFMVKTTCGEIVKEELERAGFEVELMPKDVDLMYTQIPVKDYKKKCDLLLYVANIANASYQTVARVRWTMPAAFNAPYYIKDIPTAFISVANPYHFVDVPMIRTIINAYSSNRASIRAAIEKMMGKSEFKGTSPVDPFNGFFGKDI